MATRRPLLWYLAALGVWWGSALLAARFYPGGFDWGYTVASALASQKHNPEGHRWFAGGQVLSMALLWPYLGALGHRLLSGTEVWGERSLQLFRLGVVCTALIGLERLTIRDLSGWVPFAHEFIALLAFVGLYGGILGLLKVLANRKPTRRTLVWLLIGPLIAIALSQLGLWLAQREAGWGDIAWRERGIPLGYSFAFWQWLAIAGLWLAAGLIGLLRHTDRR